MKDVSENELLSAYLDSELTAAERAKVERLLAASPAARQLLEELRALSRTLQETPKHKLGEDISKHVLQAAERRILTGSDRSGPATDSPAKDSVEPLWRTGARRLANPRGLIWSALAIAVAVMVMVNSDDRERSDVRKVAMSSAEPRELGEAVDEELAADDDSKPMPEGPSIRAKAKAAPTIHLKPKSGPSSNSIVTDVNKKTARKAGRPSSFRSRKGPEPGEPMPARTLAGKGMKKEGAAGGLVQAPQNVVIVQCEVSPEAARKQTFDKVLLQNNIAWEKTSAEERKNMVSNFAYQNAEPDATDVVYVEATTQQIEGMLADLNSQSDAFLSVEVEPVKNVPTQQAWASFSRSNLLADNVSEKEQREESSKGIAKRRATSANVQQGIAQRLPTVQSQSGAVVDALRQVDQLQNQNIRRPQSVELKRGDLNTIAQRQAVVQDKTCQVLFVLRVAPAGVVAEEQKSDAKGLPIPSKRLPPAKPVQ